MLKSKFCRLSTQWSSSASLFLAARFNSSNSVDDFKVKFWAPINDQKARTGLDNVKEAAQKFQMVGHVQKLMVNSNNNNSISASSSSSSASSTFSWAGVQANHPQVVEDFLIFLSCGFDIKSVDCENNVFVLEHARNFLGWKPAPAAVPQSPSSYATATTTTTETASSSGSEETVNKNPNLLRLPFEMKFELREVVPSLSRPTNSSSENNNNNSNPDQDVIETEQRFSSVKFDCPLVDTLRSQTKCPPEILSCLDADGEGGREPVKMVVALRKAGVRPEIISWRALKSATKKTSTWASALGVL